MSSNNPNGSNSGTLLDPIIDLFVILIEELINLMIFLFEKLFELTFNRNAKSKQRSISLKDLSFKKVTIDSKDLGLSALTKKPVKLSSLHTHLHTLLIGSSGWGKSNTLNLLFENSIKKDLPIVFVDPKGSRQAIREFTSLCLYYKKDYHIFSDLLDYPKKFDLFYGLDTDEVVTAIMRSIDWSEIYYKSQAQSFLFRAVKKLRIASQPVTLISIFEYLEENEKDNKELAGLRANLEMIAYSSFANLIDFSVDDLNNNQVTSLPEIKDDRSCLYIGLSTQGKGDIARIFGKLFLNTMLMISHHAGASYDHSSDAIENGLSFVMDEAGSMVFPDFIELLNKCRSSGIQVYACIQSLADLDTVSPQFKKQCFENFGTIILFKQSEPENAKYLSESIGTVETFKTTDMQEDGNLTGRGSIRESREFICHPDILRSIGIGKAVLVTRNPYRVNLLNIRYVSDSEAFKNPPSIKFRSNNFSREVTRECTASNRADTSKVESSTDSNNGVQHSSQFIQCTDGSSSSNEKGGRYTDAQNEKDLTKQDYLPNKSAIKKYRGKQNLEL